MSLAEILNDTLAERGGAAGSGPTPGGGRGGGGFGAGRGGPR